MLARQVSLAALEGPGNTQVTERFWTELAIQWNPFAGFEGAVAQKNVGSV